jgi:hypothetical protein
MKLFVVMLVTSTSTMGLPAFPCVPVPHSIAPRCA